MYRIIKEPDVQIVLITVADPNDFKKTPPEIEAKIIDALGGDVSEPFFAIYDVRELSLDFANILDWVSGARRKGAIETIITRYGHAIIVGEGPPVKVGAKIAQHLSLRKNFQVFSTTEEALAYARTKLVELSSSE